MINDEDIVRSIWNKTYRSGDKELYDNKNTQFLCVMNGGLLVQDCRNHATGFTHGIVSIDMKYLYEITSTHHQMQYPYNLENKDYEVLFTSNGIISDGYYGPSIDSEKICEKGEPEIVLYHKEGLPKCLAVQGHPEMIPNSPVAKMISNLIEKLIDELK